MEHISEILKQAQRNTPNRSTDAQSSAEPAETEPGPVCPICKGVKFVYPLLPTGKPDYSRVVPCQCTQKEAAEGRQAHLQRYSNLGSLTRLTFASIPKGKSESSATQEQFKRACEAAKAFAADPKGWLVLVGPSGSGKTHLAAAIANHCIENGQPVFYITTPDLLDHLRSSFGPNSEVPYDEFFEQVRNAPLLILDDLGAQSSTPWAKEKLDQLVNHRLNNQLPTVIVSIVPIEELEERIRTRLLNSSLCQIYELGEKAVALSTSGWAPGFERQKKMTFENFDKRPNLSLDQRDNLRAACDNAIAFAESPKGWLVFWGGNGCGKTHLAAAIVNYRFKMKKPALFIVVPDFLDHLRSTFTPESKISYDHLFEAVKSTPLLVLDDFGRQTTTPWAQEKLYQVINYRYNAELPTVITSNYAPEELDSAICSRFRDSMIVMLFNITAPNYYSGETSPKRTSRSDRREA
jgi:DNA replication protein DnaC